MVMLKIPGIPKNVHPSKPTKPPSQFNIKVDCHESEVRDNILTTKAIKYCGDTINVNGLLLNM
jgi:hypothetical protein